MTTAARKPGPGKGHTRSLANLLQPFQSGQNWNPTGKRGPIITPLLRSYSTWAFTDLARLASDQERMDSIPVRDAIAITLLLKAARDVPWGDKARQQVLDRLDGSIEKADVNRDGSTTIVNIIRNNVPDLGIGPASIDTQQVIDDSDTPAG